MARPWLKARGEGLDVERRARWWRERESKLAHDAPALLESTPRPPEAHGWIDSHLPVATLRDEVHGQLLSLFGEELRELGVDLDAGALGQAKSWLEVRDWLPSAKRCAVPSTWVAELSDPTVAHDRCFELFASPVLGAGLGRYPDAVTDLVARTRGQRTLRLWDAGCATGEGTWELALALATDGVEVEALGSTPWPLERLMAEARHRPHEPTASEALQAHLDAHPGQLERVSMHFADGDLRSPAEAPERYDVVICHGVLGRALSGKDASRALERLASAVVPGGLLSITDRFRQDRSLYADRLVDSAVHLGLRRLGRGLLQRPG